MVATRQARMVPYWMNAWQEAKAREAEWAAIAATLKKENTALKTALEAIRTRGDH